MKGYAPEFLLTVLAVIVGLAIAKQIRKGVAKVGIPISYGDPVKRPLPGKV